MRPSKVATAAWRNSRRYTIVNAAGDVDTGDWLGWINIASKPYIFSYSVGWIYMNEPAAGGAGDWGYLYTQAPRLPVIISRGAAVMPLSFLGYPLFRVNASR